MKPNLLMILIAIAFLVGCTQSDVDKTNASITSGDKTAVVASHDVTQVKPSERIALSWENTTAPHPERKPWSDKLTSIIKTDLVKYSEAKDITRICPKYKTLKDEQKIKAIGELYVGLAYYESSFNPKSFSVDVGNKNNKETWSVGLYSMSGVDSASRLYGADFTKLQDPLINIQVAAEQIRRQLKNTGLLILPNSSKYRYYAVILDGNKYSKVSEILARVKKNSPSCN